LARPKSEILGEKSEIRNPKSENAGDWISDFGFRISDFGFRIWGHRVLEQDIGRLEVAVNDSLLMGRGYRPGQDFHQPRRLRSGQRRTLAMLLQAAAVDEFEGKERLSRLFADLIDLHDVGVMQPGNGRSFSAEAVALARPSLGTGADHFEGHDSVQLDLPGLVDDAHAAVTDLLQNLVPSRCRRPRARSRGAVAGSAGGLGGALLIDIRQGLSQIHWRHRKPRRILGMVGAIAPLLPDAILLADQPERQRVGGSQLRKPRDIFFQARAGIGRLRPGQAPAIFQVDFD
jgi:hypothetical protein